MARSYNVVTVTIELEDNTNIALKELEEKLEEANRQVGEKAQEYAKQYETAIDTGRLNRSITHWSKGNVGHTIHYSSKTKKEYEKDISTNEEKVVYIGTDVDYGFFIEEGSIRHRPLHFLRRAMVEHTSEYKSIYESVLSQDSGGFLSSIKGFFRRFFK